MKSLEQYKLSREEIAIITDGITYCGYIEVTRHLWNTGQYDQLAVIDQQFNRGALQFEDWDYNHNHIPEC